jgi:hypothetical protein
MLSETIRVHLAVGAGNPHERKFVYQVYIARRAKAAPSATIDPIGG